MKVGTRLPVLTFKVWFRLIAWYLYYMVTQYMVRSYKGKTVFQREKKMLSIKTNPQNKIP